MVSQIETHIDDVQANIAQLLENVCSEVIRIRRDRELGAGDPDTSGLETTVEVLLVRQRLRVTCNTNLSGVFDRPEIIENAVEHSCIGQSAVGAAIHCYVWAKRADAIALSMSLDL